MIICCFLTYPAQVIFHQVPIHINNIFISFPLPPLAHLLRPPQKLTKIYGLKRNGHNFLSKSLGAWGRRPKDASERAPESLLPGAFFSFCVRKPLISIMQACMHCAPMNVKGSGKIKLFLSVLGVGERRAKVDFLYRV